MIEYDEFGPEKILKVYDPKTGMKGITVIHNTARGPGKGGIRMTPSVNEEEVFRLARAMSWKCALADLPFGGGKSGIIANAKELDKDKKKAIVQAFSKAIKAVCPSEYVSAPDISMAEEEMRWFAEANGSNKSCTGKPADLGGLPHELGSTGIGVGHATMVAIEYLGLNPSELTFAVEGFGNVGWFASKYLTEKGLKLIAVSDSKGTLVNKRGIDFNKLVEVKKEKRTVTGCEKGEVCDNKEIFKIDADILITAAVPDLISDEEVDSVKAKLIVCGSNIPFSLEAEKKFHEKGILVIPDFVANAGGVISSYVEYIEGSVDDMWKMVEEKIIANTKIMLERSKEQGIIPRDAAMEIAKERIRG